jgi:sugar phosphate isomerase/epimerase
MIIALSTRWNAFRHASGESLADDIIAAGFDHVELSYDLRVELLEGLKNRLHTGAIRVDSVHAPCPVPVGLPGGNPEYYTLAEIDEAERTVALRLVRDTLRFAAEMGARVVVTHAGNVEMPHYSYKIIDLQNSRFHASWWTRWRINRLKTRLDVGRVRHVQPHLDALSRSIESLMPDLESLGVTLALENLPTWESIPSESELGALLERFPSPRLAAWYDIGHGVSRQRLGFSNPIRWLDKFGPRLAGMHIHDVDPRNTDHLAPGQGSQDFKPFRRFAEKDMIRVVEVRPGLPLDKLKAGLNRLREDWESPIDAAGVSKNVQTGD